MAEAHVNITSDSSGNQVRFHNPATHPLPSSAAKPVTANKDASGKVISAHGQVDGGSSVVFDNPS